MRGVYLFKRDKMGEKGFTLVEIAIAVGIMIVLLVAFLKYVPGIMIKKNVTVVSKMVENIKGALNSYKGDVGSYPTHLQALWDQTAVSPASSQPYWHGPYMDQPSQISGSSPNEDIQDSSIAGVVYYYAAVGSGGTVGGGGTATGNCGNVSAIVPNDANGIVYTIEAANVPQEVAWALSSAMGNAVCLSSTTDPNPNVYFLVDTVWH